MIEARATEPAKPAAARASPTRSTRTWRCCTAPAAWTTGKLPTPRADGDREALRILLCARQELTTTSHRDRPTGCARCCATATTPTGALARARFTDTVLASAGPPPPACRSASRDQAVRHAEIRRLAAGAAPGGPRAEGSTATKLATIIDDLAPGLTDRPGIGPVSAAQAIVSFSHPGRCRNDAAFAKLAGTSPLEASSGQTTRHRLNRRRRPGAQQSHPHHRASPECAATPPPRPTSPAAVLKASPTREIRRCLKRYIARQLTALSPPR